MSNQPVVTKLREVYPDVRKVLGLVLAVGGQVDALVTEGGEVDCDRSRA